MQTIFFTGKGGVGKSTLSAATAWQLADRGHKVLAVSFDPAHNLGDIFGLALSHRRKQFSENLWLQEIDLDKSAAQYIEENIDLLGQVYSYTRAFNFDTYFKTMRYSPGVEEYAALTALQEIISTETEFEYIVFDTPPTGLTLRILALPNITITWVDRLRRIRRELLKKRHTIHNLDGTYIAEGVILPYEEKDDTVLRNLNAMWKRYVELYNVLQSKSNSIAVVFNPDYLSLRESQRIVSGLSDLRLPLRAAYNNKCTAETQDTAAEVEEQLLNKRPDVDVVRVPRTAYRREYAYEVPVELTAPFLSAGL